MRILLVNDLLLSATNPERLAVKAFHKWQSDRMLKLEDLLDKAQQRQTRHICLFGSMFGQKIVPEKTVDDFFNAVKEEKNIQVYAFCGYEEYQLISYRNDIPSNFHLFCLDASDSKEFNELSITADHDTAVITSDAAKGIIVHEDDSFTINGKTIPSFEPAGFDDAEGKEFGFMIWDTAKKDNAYEVIRDQKYHYRSEELKILPEDTQQDILEKVNDIIRKADIDTFLRITITGKTAFGITINADGLKNKMLNRVFSLEVYDNSVMDVNEEMFENDISLRSEFVRLALNDETLSEGERNQLISYGWNALNGKGMSEE